MPHKYLLMLILLCSCYEESYFLKNENVGYGRSCDLNGKVFSNGESLELFKSQFVLDNSDCVSEFRTCNMGKFNGTYSYSSCVVVESEVTDDCGIDSIQSNFFWSDPPVLNGNEAYGEINGISYKYISSKNIQTTDYVFGVDNFPSEFKIPNQSSIKNIEITTNSLIFEQPLQNPVIVFASIGQPSLYVDIEFDAPIQILWSKNIEKDNETRIVGNEGFAVIRFNGLFDTISFRYLVKENWANFTFGADFFTYCSL